MSLRRLGFKRVHIVSCAARTGTTLLAEMMVTGFRFDAFAEHEMSVFRRPIATGEVVLTKDPTEIRNVGPLLWWWPDLWVLCLVRDPRDVVTSTHGGAPGTYYVGLNQWKDCLPATRRLASHPRVLLLRYEDLVTDPDSVQQRIHCFMPFLEKRTLFSQFHLSARPSSLSVAAMRGLRPVSPASVGAWRQHKPRVAAQIQRHGPITKELIEFGYEQDDGWLCELEGVVPDNQATFLKEEHTWKERVRFSLWRCRNLLRCYLSTEPRAEVIQS